MKNKGNQNKNNKSVVDNMQCNLDESESGISENKNNKNSNSQNKNNKNNKHNR